MSSIPLLPDEEEIDALFGSKTRDLLKKFTNALIQAPFRAVGPREPERVFHEIVVDSLAPIFVGAITEDSPARFLDLGSGPGIPSIPLSAVLTDAKITGIDSTGKRIRFARDFSWQNGLADRMNFLQGRIHPDGHMETIETKKFAEDFRKAKFDHLLSRAFVPLEQLPAYSKKWLDSGGSVIAYTTERALEESVIDADIRLKSYPYKREEHGSLYAIAVLERI